MEQAGQQNAPDELIRQCAAGDDAAFEELSRRYRRSMEITAWDFVDPSSADEVVDRALAQAREQLRDGAAPQHAGVWLNSITREIAREELRARLLTPPPDFSATPAPAAAHADEPAIAAVALAFPLRLPHFTRTAIAGLAIGVVAVAAALGVLFTGSDEGDGAASQRADSGPAYATSEPTPSSTVTITKSKPASKKTKPRQRPKPERSKPSSAAPAADPVPAQPSSTAPAPAAPAPATPAPSTPSTSPASEQPASTPPTVTPPPVPSNPSPSPTPPPSSPPANGGCTGIVGCVVDAVGGLLGPR